MGAATLRILASTLALAMLARSSNAGAAAESTAPPRIQVATGAELATTTGPSSEVFMGPYLHLSYRLMPQVSIGVVGAYAAFGTSVGDDNLLDCGSGAERHLWRLTAGVRAHSSGLEPLEVWGGIESGVGVMHSIYIVSCAAGLRGPAFEHRSLLDQVAPLAGPVAGVSLFIGRHVSIDLAVRGLLAFFPADERPGTDNLGTRAIVAVGLGASVHFGR